MRKHCKRHHRRAAAPTLVAYYLNPEVSTQERMSVEAIRAGWAKTAHFDVLADCRDMLALAQIKRLLRDLEARDGSISGALSILVKAKRVQRTGQRRDYCYYLAEAKKP